MRRTRKPGQAAARHRLIPTFGVGILALLAVPGAGSAHAETARVGGAVAISQSVGTEIAFDVTTQALSAIFLSGRPGESVSVVLGASGKAASSVGAAASVVLSTGSWRIDLTQRAGVPGSDRAPPGTVDDTSLLILAQFN